RFAVRAGAGVAFGMAYTSARREGELHFLWQKLRNLHFVCPVGVTSPGGAWYAGTCKSFSPAQKEADKMEHMAWKGRVKTGCKAEYQRRHNEIWPEMVAVLKEAGICNYSIFYVNDELFGYYECEKGVAWAEKVQAESPVVARWNEYMA